MWFWPWKKKWYKVTLREDAINVRNYSGDFEVYMSVALAEFIRDNDNCQHALHYDERTGDRWIEFKDKQMATICRLTLG